MLTILQNVSDAGGIYSDRHLHVLLDRHGQPASDTRVRRALRPSPRPYARQQPNITPRHCGNKKVRSRIRPLFLQFSIC